MTALTHPAKFSTPILAEIDRLLTGRLAPESSVLDPFAGVGGVHALPYTTVGVEIEPEWAGAHPQTVCGDSTRLTDLFPGYEFDAVVTSPAYGNRMADSYAGDPKGTRRFTYRVSLGRSLSEGNGAGLQWGEAYRELHAAVWAECSAVLRSGGLMVVNVSNHVRKGVEQPVVEWHLSTLLGLGFRVDEVMSVATRRMRFGANGEKRSTAERILVMSKP